MTIKDTEWEKTLRATIASQEETIALLTTQLSNEKLKNTNLESIVKCTCKN